MLAWGGSDQDAEVCKECLFDGCLLRALLMVREVEFSQAVVNSFHGSHLFSHD